ncbi:MAG TPA: HepT-like ribonuclease domain-containing protein [Candidatus Methylomirabilis sp.]|nr:HepT-like ribonuclease domain-containing protein [Candidatus Methylomirabilis sp.]
MLLLPEGLDRRSQLSRTRGPRQRRLRATLDRSHRHPGDPAGRGVACAEALSALAAAGVIPTALGTRLVGVVRLRNILVHDDLDIDHGRLFDELDWIERAEEFAAAIEYWLERNADLP